MAGTGFIIRDHSGQVHLAGGHKLFFASSIMAEKLAALHDLLAVLSLSQSQINVCLESDSLEMIQDLQHMLNNRQEEYKKDPLASYHSRNHIIATYPLFGEFSAVISPAVAADNNVLLYTTSVLPNLILLFCRKMLQHLLSNNSAVLEEQMQQQLALSFTALHTLFKLNSATFSDSYLGNYSKVILNTKSGFQNSATLLCRKLLQQQMSSKSAIFEDRLQLKQQQFSEIFIRKADSIQDVVVLLCSKLLQQHMDKHWQQLQQLSVAESYPDGHLCEVKSASNGKTTGEKIHSSDTTPCRNLIQQEMGQQLMQTQQILSVEPHQEAQLQQIKRGLTAKSNQEANTAFLDS